MGLILPDLLGSKLVWRLVKIRREFADDSDIGFCGTNGSNYDAVRLGPTGP